MTIGNATSVNAAQLYKANGPAEGVAGREPQKASPSGERHVVDRVEISPQGRLAAVAQTYLNSVEAGLRNFQENSAAFRDELSNRFRDAGIDTSQPVDLVVDSRGNVRTAGDHPDKDRIEALFAEDAELANEFRQLSATAELKKAVEEHLEFARAYEQSPKTAIAQFAHMFSGESRDSAQRFSVRD